MFNLDNIDLNRQFASAEEASEYIRRYIFQFYIESNYRMEELDRRIREIEEKSNDNATS